MRFSLLRMLVVVALIALGCAGLMYRSAGWVLLLVNFTIGLYAIMTLRAVGQRAGPRAFSLGFAAAGITYLLLASCPFFDPLRESLYTNYPLAWAARWVAERDPGMGIVFVEKDPFGNPFSSTTYDPLPIQGSPSPVAVPPSLSAMISLVISDTQGAIPVGRFFLIGHCLWSWLFAWLAGWIAERRYVRRREVVLAE